MKKVYLLTLEATDAAVVERMRDEVGGALEDLFDGERPAGYDWSCEPQEPEPEFDAETVGEAGGGNVY